jgi:Fe-S-cluster containining protein
MQTALTEQASEREKAWTEVAFGVLTSEYVQALQEVPGSVDGAQTTRRYYRRYELVQERVIANEAKANGDRIACTKGCAYCCHNRVTAPAHEILTLANGIEQLPDPLRATVIERVARNAERVEAMQGAEMFRTPMRCALLDEGSSCSMYDDRPSACRRYHSLEVRDCETSFSRPKDLGSKIRLSTPLMAVSSAQSMGFRKVLAEAGLDTTNYELHTALREALADPHACGQRFGRGERTFLHATVYADPIRTD